MHPQKEYFLKSVFDVYFNPRSVSHDVVFPILFYILASLQSRLYVYQIHESLPDCLCPVPPQFWQAL